MSSKESPAPLAGGGGAISQEQPMVYSTERDKSEGHSPRLARPVRPIRRGPHIDFAEINRAALAHFLAILRRLLPDGRLIGREYVARNPRRNDHKPGSFKVNVVTGLWADFSSGDRGGDPVSLMAFLGDVSQSQAARLLARMLGVGCGTAP